jgi:hypothetical protein
MKQNNKQEQTDSKQPNQRTNKPDKNKQANNSH